MSITLEQLGSVAIIRLNRPKVYNSFNREMALEVQAALDQYQTDASVRAVILIGEGKAFCAGQDLQEVVDPEGPSLQTILSEHYNPIVLKIRQLRKPVIAAVNGVAAGAGANIALAADVVLASESASFIQAFSKIGLIPDSGGTFTLPRLVGFQRASALMMLGDKVTATEALAMGMCYKVLPDEGFFDAAMQLAQTLAAMPTHGLWLTKNALNQSMTNSLEAQLATEETLQIEAGNTADFSEGVQAFLEKRKPQFHGN